MKKMYLLFLFLFLAGTTHGQWVIEPLDNSVQSGFWDPAGFFSTGGDKSKMDLTDIPNGKFGGAVQVDYTLVATESWGGFLVRTTPNPLPKYYDLSAATELRFWYKVNTPVVKTSDGQTFVELKMGDIDEQGRRDLWFHQTTIDLSDASGEWKEIVIPLVYNSDKTLGLALQDQQGLGDQELQLDKIKTFELAMTYLLPGNNANPPLASGSFSIDNFQIVGNAYPPIFTFDNSAASWNTDWMDWAGADKGAIALSDESTDKAEGEGSLKIDYTLSAPYDWGGFLSIDQDVTKPEKFEERTGLVFYVKNVTPIAADSGRAFIRFFIMENSNGDNEEWIIDANLDLSQTFGWTRVLMPFIEKPLLVENNDRFPPKDGFATKSKNGNKLLDPASITKIRIEIFGRGTSDGFAAPLKGSGTVLFDVVQQTGYKIFDLEAPEAPGNFAVIPGNYTNLVTWSDVTNEGASERYNIYYSKTPFTSTTDQGVMVLKKGIEENTLIFDHLLNSPLKDRQETYYYAINAVDKAGNIGALSFSDAVTNNARGISTVSLSTPNFAADGDLSEWTYIKPFRMFLSDASAFLSPNFKVDSDADLSAEAYLAMDGQYLYAAFDVNDDIVAPDENQRDYAEASYALDSPDLLFGLYDLATNEPHGVYQRGANSDQFIRFNKLRARNDHYSNQVDTLLVAGTENYYWGEKFTGGYIVEARIPWTLLETKRNRADATKDTISVHAGWKIPFNITINDNDGRITPDYVGGDNRQGMIHWSPFDRGSGWNNPSLWMYTWIGDNDDVDTGVEDNILPETYSLAQNFPNPFNPTTQIKYNLAKAGMVSLRIFDVLGREVSQLVNQFQEKGSYTVNFNASHLATGMYIYKLESGSFSSVKKMMLVK